MEKEKKPKLHLMIDIETLGTNVNYAPIVSIAVHSFDPTSDMAEGREVFEANLDINASVMFLRRRIDTETLLWWHSQPEESMRKAFSNPIAPNKAMREMLDELKSLAETYDLYLWCKGTDFDIPIIESYLEACDLSKLPYFFSHKYDVRTVLKIAEMQGWVDEYKDKVKHTAMGDCINQINQVRSAIKFLKK